MGTWWFVMLTKALKRAVPSPPRRLTCTRWHPAAGKLRLMNALWHRRVSAGHYLVAELAWCCRSTRWTAIADSVRLPGAPPGTEEFFAWPKDPPRPSSSSRSSSSSATGRRRVAASSALQELGLSAMLREAAPSTGSRRRARKTRPAARVVRRQGARGVRRGDLPAGAAAVRRDDEHSVCAGGGGALAGGAGRRGAEVHARLRPALRVDPLLVGARAAVRSALGGVRAHRRRLRPVGARLVRADAARLLDGVDAARLQVRARRGRRRRQRRRRARAARCSRA